jgi:hypothetical protein
MSYNLEQFNSGYVSLTSGAIAITTNKAKFKTTATITFLLNGLFYSKAATDNLVFSSGHTSLGASQACLFGLWLDASGNVTTTQGPIVNAGDPCPVPSNPGNRALFGLIKVVTGASGAFVPNTTEFDASGVTTTYINAAAMPGTAQ